MTDDDGPAPDRPHEERPPPHVPLPSASLPAASLPAQPAASAQAEVAPDPDRAGRQFVPPTAPPLPGDLARARQNRTSGNGSGHAGWMPLAAVVVLVVVGALLFTLGGSDDDSAVVRDVTPTRAAEPASPSPGTEPEATSFVLGQPIPEVLDGSLAFGASVPVEWDSRGDADGSVWNVTVGAPSDLTDAVMDANQFNEPPPDGVLFAGIDVEATLASAAAQPLNTGFDLDWQIVGGATGQTYDTRTIVDPIGCGVVAREFDELAAVLVGGTVRGVVCIPIPSEDLNHPDTRVVMSFRSERVTFADGGQVVPPAELEEPVGMVGGEIGYGAAVPIRFETFGEADGSVWNIRVDPPFDVTDEVLEESPFTEPPPDGIVFAAFDVSMMLVSAEYEPVVADGFYRWEIIGGATGVVHDAGTIPDAPFCGLVMRAFNQRVGLYVGGDNTGTVCIPLPVEDLMHPSTRVALNVGGNRFEFVEGGDTPDPLEIGSVTGPAGLGDTTPFGASAELQFELDREGPTSWATAVLPLRDITDEVADEGSIFGTPPEGYTYAGFDVQMRLLDQGRDPQLLGFDIDWEVHGGASLGVYGRWTLEIGCGVFEGEFDPHSPVSAVRPTAQGTVCITIPADDLNHPDTRVVLNGRGDRQVFGG